MLEQYGEEYFLRLYLKIRIMEMEGNLPQHIKEKLIRDTINQYFSGSRTAAIGAFEKVVGKTYTSSGSLTKRIEGDKLRKEEAFQEDELQGAVSTYR